MIIQKHQTAPKNRIFPEPAEKAYNIWIIGEWGQRENGEHCKEIKKKIKKSGIKIENGTQGDHHHYLRLITATKTTARPQSNAQ